MAKIGEQEVDVLNFTKALIERTKNSKEIKPNSWC